jgi:UDP-N-acetyl-D-mannosaminuronic acid dehydrogenase
VDLDVVIIGGFGHVGLPLAISLAHRGLRVCAFDLRADAAEMIQAGRMPFREEGAEELLQETLRRERLLLSLDPSVITRADTVIIVIGTPVDGHLNPAFDAMREAIGSYLEFFRDGQLIVLRSTVYPGTTDRLQDWFWDQGKCVDLAFCPERIAEGVAIRELTALPQVISSPTEAGLERSRRLFGLLTDEIIVVNPIEAELTKLFNNVWRYIKFAAANQFFMIADEHGADFHRILNAMSYKYPRGQDMAGPGFAAGPCLFKDAMQLAAFNNNTFYLGHAAMLINEGLPNYVVSRLKQNYDLRQSTVGILGMAYKAGSDDPRESLSFKLKKILSFESRAVLCSDPYICSEDFVSADRLVGESDIIIVGTPHKEYASLSIPNSKVLVDIWNIFGRGCLIARDAEEPVHLGNGAVHSGVRSSRSYNGLDDSGDKAGPTLSAAR